MVRYGKELRVPFWVFQERAFLLIFCIKLSLILLDKKNKVPEKILTPKTITSMILCVLSGSGAMIAPAFFPQVEFLNTVGILLISSGDLGHPLERVHHHLVTIHESKHMNTQTDDPFQTNNTPPFSQNLKNAP